MSATEDPRCPECGEPIGQTATYCMHCSADLSGRAATEGTAQSTGTGTGTGTSTTDAAGEGQLLDPEGLLDNSLTVVVGIVGGLVIGIVATITLAFLTASGLALLGVVAWLVSTAYLARQRTVQGAVSKAAYGVALVLLLVPLIPLSPMVDMDPGSRALGFVMLVFLVGTPAAIAAGIGYVASRYVPETGEPTDY